MSDDAVPTAPRPRYARPRFDGPDGPTPVDGPPPAAPPRNPSPPGGPASGPSLVLAALAAGAGVIHLALVPDHAAEWRTLGVAFALVGWAQLLVALGLVVRPSRKLLAAGAVLSVAVVAVWAYTRVIGWPVGPEHGTTEAAHFVDGLAGVLELGFAAGAAGVAFLRTDRRPGRPRRVRSALAVAASGLLVVGVTTAALAAPSTAEHQHDAAASVDHQHDATVVAGAATGADAGASAAAAATDTTGASGAAADGHPAHDHTATGSGTGADATGGASGAASTDAGHVHAACTAPVTPGQQAAADQLIAATRAAIAPDADLATAVAAGYRPVTPPTAPVVHYVDPAYLRDGDVLDPSRPESLVYAFSSDHRTAYLLGAMYLMDDPTATPPQPGGCETVWHAHTNLCLAPGVGVVGTVAADGSCPAGSANSTTAMMMHVWAIDLPAGPFSELDATSRPQLAAAVKAAVRGGTLTPSPVPG